MLWTNARSRKIDIGRHSSSLPSNYRPAPTGPRVRHGTLRNSLNKRRANLIPSPAPASTCDKGLGQAGKLFQAGQLAIVQGVSHPNPNRSHFRSMAGCAFACSMTVNQLWHPRHFLAARVVNDARSSRRGIHSCVRN